MALSFAHQIGASSLTMTKQTVSFLGLDLQPMPTPSVVAEMVAMAGQGNPFKYVVTPNVDHMIRLEAEPDLRPLYDGAGLLVNDSRILEMLAERDGLAFPASPGADIVAALFEDEIKPDEPVVVIPKRDNSASFGV